MTIPASIAAGTKSKALARRADDPNMDCLKCGADIGAAIGLCTPCKEQRATKPSRSTTIQRSMERSQHAPKRCSSEYGKYLVGLILAPIMIYVAVAATRDDQIAITRTPSSLILSSADKTSVISYGIGSGQYYTGHLVDYDVQRLSLKQGGFKAIAVFLTDEQYAEYQAIRGCKAAFMNANMNLLLLVPSSDEAVSQLGSASIPKGARVSFYGADLETDSVTLDGNLFPTESWFAQNKKVAVAEINVLSS